MANTKFKSFLNSLVGWLRSDATLVALLGGDTTRIAVESSLYEFDVPCLILENIFHSPMSEDSDTGLYVAELTCAAFAETRADALVIIGQISELAKQKATMFDASFKDTVIQTESLRAIGESPVSLIETERGTGRASIRLRITWKEVS